MLTFKYHRFLAAAATAAVTAVVMLTTGSIETGASLNAQAAVSAQAAAEEEPRTIYRTEEGQTGPGHVIDASLNVSAADTQALRDGRKLTGGLLRQTVEMQMEKELLLKQQAEENAKILEEQELKAAKAAINCSAEDYQTLLKIVQAEAGICDEKGKILVANVIINRVKSGRFPNTVTGVVYQKNQFSPVSNGSINRAQVTRETIECVDRALAGEDYSQGALFFMNRSRSRQGAVGWFDRSLTYLFSHDGHEFFK